VNPQQPTRLGIVQPLFHQAKVELALGGQWLHVSDGSFLDCTYSVPRPSTSVGPPLRQRYLPADRRSAYEHPAGAAVLDEQHLRPLTPRRMERMRDNDETQIVTARSVIMPLPSECPAAVPCPTRPVWGSCVPAPVEDITAHF
jgi:hypothetical protein